MSTHKHINKICVIAIVLSLVFTICAMLLPTYQSEEEGRQMGYENRLFDTKRVHTIDIVIDDWEGFLSTAQKEEYSLCSVIIDGEAVKNVGIRGKGNTSLSTVSSMDSNRYSFKIEFDQYDSMKSYYGLDKLCLNNIIQDNTYMKDYLVYQMMREFGVDAPLCSFVYITVNGEDWGLYLAVEGVEESFLQRNYGADYGELYKPDSMDFGGGRGNGMGFDMSNFNGRGSSDVKLQYIDDDTDSYSNIFDSAKTDITSADKERLITSLKQLSAYENIEEVVDVEQVLRYFVVHNFVVNEDSYTGSMIHNYYLYEEDGKMSMIPWDYNLSFGTFQGNNASSAVNDDIDTVLSDRPMQAWIFSQDIYSQMYFDLYEEMVESVNIQGIIEDTYTLIESYVENDPTAFCTFEEFQKGVAALKEFCSLRTESIKLQLSGSTDLVDASTLNLSDMGTMSHGMGNNEQGGNGMSNNMQRPSGMQKPEDMEMPDGTELPDGMELPEGMEFPDGMEMPEGMERPDGMQMPGGMMSGIGNSTTPGTGSSMGISVDYIMIGASFFVLLAGLLFVSKFKR